MPEIAGNFTNPIVIVGSPRSGTSLVAGCLAHSGVWSGECRKADPINPKGFFENNRLAIMRRKGILDPARVRKVLEQEGWRGEPWLCKHAPWAVDRWRRFNPVYVLVWRSVERILESRMRCGMYAETASAARSAVLEHHRAMDAIDRTSNDVVDVFPDMIMRGDLVGISAVLGYYDMKVDFAAADDFLETSLWHKNESAQSI